MHAWSLVNSGRCICRGGGYSPSDMEPGGGEYLPPDTGPRIPGRVPTRPGKPGKPGKMRVLLENLEISWNFEKFNKYHGKMT